MDHYMRSQAMVKSLVKVKIPIMRLITRMLGVHFITPVWWLWGGGGATSCAPIRLIEHINSCLKAQAAESNLDLKILLALHPRWWSRTM